MILRVYESHDVLGKVTHYCPPNDQDHALWRVRFGDESDEVDDLDFEELNVALEKYNMNRSSLGKLYVVFECLQLLHFFMFQSRHPN